MAYGIVSSQASTTINMSPTYVTIPTLNTDTFVYNSTTIDITEYLNDYDPEFMFISGTSSATNVGEYTVTFDLKSESNTVLTWEDDTTEVKSITWSITKQPVSVPAVTNTSKTYNTNEQSPTIATYDTNVINVSGNTGTNAGNYTIEFTLKDTTNYQWASGSTPTVSWSIAKATGSVSVNPTSLTLTSANKTQTATVTRLGDGTITATSSNTGVATCSISDTTVSVTGVASGSTTITINVGEGTNYLATSTTLSITTQLIDSTLNNNSWAVISEVALAGTGDTYWDVGDCKAVVVNGTIGGSNTGSVNVSNQTLYAFILDFNHAMNGTAENNIIFGGFKSAVTSGKDVAIQGVKMNSTNTNSGGWKGCDCRYEALGNGASKNTDATTANLTSPRSNTLLAALPSDLRSAIRLWTRWVGKGNNDTNSLRTSVDAVTLLTESEIFGSRTYSNQYEKNYSAQMAYYKAGNSKVKYNHSNTSSSVFWWECSPHYNSSSIFCCVYSDGNANFADATGTFGLAPAWKI